MSDRELLERAAARLRKALDLHREGVRITEEMAAQIDAEIKARRDGVNAPEAIFARMDKLKESPNDEA